MVDVESFFADELPFDGLLALLLFRILGDAPIGLALPGFHIYLLAELSLLKTA